MTATDDRGARSTPPGTPSSPGDGDGIIYADHLPAVQRRDVTFREDLHQTRTGTGPAVIATLRNTAIGYHRTIGATDIAHATRQANRRSHDLIIAVTSSYPTTQ
jgi:hypothetical protein